MTSLAYTIDGPPDAPVLVLSGSLGSTVDMWQPQVAALGTHWRILRLDHPGHGASPIWNEPVTVSDIGQAVRELLTELGFDRVSFCGLSLGGAVGQWLAAHAPESVECLVLCSTAAQFPNRDAYRQRATVVRKQGTGAISAAVVDRWFTPDFHGRQPAVVETFRRMIESIPPEGYAACCEAVAAFDGRQDLTAIRASTLVIAGADDPAIPVEQARALCSGIAGARLLVIPQAAHVVNVEQPEVVNTAIMEHLSEVLHA